MSGAAIEVKGLSFAYNGHKILAGVDFSVEPGEYVTVIGPNGVGKSTLLKCLNRILPVTEGRVCLFGRDLRGAAQKDLAKMVGYVPQNQDQAFPYTVSEFVLMGRYPYLQPFERPAQRDEEIVREIIDLVGISDFVQRRVNTLSGGERQKVYLAGALAQEPKILLLDEPTAHLDPRHHIQIQKIISEVCAKKGIAVLHVTHDLNHIVSWSNKIMAMKDGKIWAFGAPEEVMTAERLKGLFNARFLLIPHPVTGQQIVVPEVNS